MESLCRLSCKIDLNQSELKSSQVKSSKSTKGLAKRTRLFIYSVLNGPPSLYQYSNMDPKLLGQIANFQVLFLNSQKRLGYKENTTKYGYKFVLKALVAT